MSKTKSNFRTVSRIIGRFSRRKTYGLEESDSLSEHGGPAKLDKVLNTFDLTLLGVGSTLGVGIYVLAGSVALHTAGPAVCISFLVAAVASAFAAMCYAEFGARVPKAGSAYIYSYVTVGEFIAFIIGWNLILEYLIGTASVARAFSSNVDALANYSMSEAFLNAVPINADYLSPYADFFSLAIILCLSVLLGFGVRSSAIFTNIFTFVNVAVVIFVIIAGSINADPRNWNIPASEVPSGYGTGGFAPYGFSGIMAGAAKCFFAFVGFDSIAATGEEAKNPTRSIPFSINLTLIIVFIGYFGVSTALTLMWPYYLQDANTPLIYAFRQIGWDIAAWTITIGSIFGLAASLLGAMIPLPRILYAKAKDGLIFRFLAYVSPKFKTPVISTAVAGVMAAALATIFDLDTLVDMMSIGTLLAYTLVAICVLILRYEESETASSQIERAGKIKYPWKKSSTKKTSKAAIYATAAYCALAIILCGILVGMESAMDGGVYFGMGIILGIMIALIFYMFMLPRTTLKLYFMVPGVPLVPCLSVIINVYLMMKLSVDTWIRFGVWMAVGFLMYFLYGLWNSSEEYVMNGKPVPGAFTKSVSPTGHDNHSYDRHSIHGDALTTVVDVEPTSQPSETEQEAFMKAILTAHNHIQNEFHKLEKPKPISPPTIVNEQSQQSSMETFMESVSQCHDTIQAVFNQIRQTKEKLSKEMESGMATFMAIVDQIHHHIQSEFDKIRDEKSQEMLSAPTLDQGIEIFIQAVDQAHKKIQLEFEKIHSEKEKEAKAMESGMAGLFELIEKAHTQIQESLTNSSIKGLTSAPPPPPMNAVFEELLTRSRSNKDLQVTSLDDDTVETPVPNTPTTPIVTTSSKMLEELRNAFKRNGKNTE